MTDTAVIAGSLVDVRNVGTHKSVKLTIHVPEEFATKVVAAFGWPTGVNPVSVAIARLDEKKLADPAKSAAEERPKSPAQIAGYLCTLPSFYKFLQTKFPDEWHRNWSPIGTLKQNIEETCKQCIYDICTVTSRTQLTKDNTEWNALQIAFQLWERHPELEDA